MDDNRARSFGLPLATLATLATHEGRISTMRDLYRDGDVDGALMVAAVIDTALEACREVTLDPDEAAERTLLHYHSGMRPTSVLALDSVLRLVKTSAEIAQLPFDHRIGFLLGLVDGATTVETILDVGAMPADEALSLLHELLVLGVVQVS